MVGERVLRATVVVQWAEVEAGRGANASEAWVGMIGMREKEIPKGRIKCALHQKSK